MYDLYFCTSCHTELVHALDLTNGCNLPNVMSSTQSEDSDGWRGYFAPFAVLGSETVGSDDLINTSKAHRVMGIASRRLASIRERP